MTREPFQQTTKQVPGVGMLVALLVCGAPLPACAVLTGRAAPEVVIPAAGAADAGPIDSAAPIDDARADAALDAELQADLAADSAGFPDPLEPLNRGTLQVNEGIDRWVLDPITKVYRFVVPDPVKHALLRVLANLDSPAVMVNDLLQREWTDAGVTTARLVVNSSVGIGGIFDAAVRLGLEGHNSDFGQTMALAGMPSGPYLMLPLFGPTTVRDGVGTLVDMFFRPATYVLGPADQLFYATLQGGSEGVAIREANADGLELLRESSVDYYAALRNAYFQNRMAAIWSRREHHRVGDSAVLTAGGEVGDLAVDAGDEGVEAVALER